MKKHKRFIMALIAASCTFSFPAFSGTWNSDGNGWRWQNEDGSFVKAAWQWIDGDSDGISECYYFNDTGYCLMNTVTPDGASVNANGAWIVDGVVQTTQTADTAGSGSVNSAAAAAGTRHSGQSSISSDSSIGTTVYLSRTGSKYHKNAGCGNMKNPIESTLEEAARKGRSPCSKCCK